MPHRPWDLTALINAADPQAARPERHLWLVRLMEWLRRADAAGLPAPQEGAAARTPRPVLKLRHLLNMLARNPEPRARVVALLRRLWCESDVAALFADTGFTPRRDLRGELAERLRLKLLPTTPDTDDLSALFHLIFTDDGDAAWLAAIDEATLAQLAALLQETQDRRPAGAQAEGPAAPWQAPLRQSFTWLISSIRAAAFTPTLRRRMDPALLADRPFEQLAPAGEALLKALAEGDAARLGPAAAYFRALLGRCGEAAASIDRHLDAHGVSVDIVFEQQQLRGRAARVEALVDTLLSDRPARELHRLLTDMVALSAQRRSLRGLGRDHYALLARKVAERHAETGEHYITRDAAAWRAMLGAALGGGLVLAFTTLAKFLLARWAVAPFWAGMLAGLNYAVSFMLIFLLHWTVATKQPAMTAPAMAAKLKAVRAARAGDEAPLSAFVDEVTHLVRSQMAGVIGNLGAVAPVVVGLQALAWWLAGRPVIHEAEAHYVLHSLTLLGPTPFYAAFTGVLLFAASLIAGWVENEFVYHRLDSALAHHPRLVARLGPARAQRWAHWWRSHVSGVAANVSLGLMLGVVPVLLAFVGLPIEVRHVTLSTGQIAAAASTLGWATLAEPAFWWCIAGVVATGALNLAVSFGLALHVALRSRHIAGLDARRIRGAILKRLATAPASFLKPPATP